MKFLAIFLTTAALFSTIVSSASASDDFPASGWKADRQAQYNNLNFSNSDYSCNSNVSATTNGYIIQNGTSSKVGVSIDITFGRPDPIRSEIEHTNNDLEYIAVLLEKYFNALASKNTELANTYSILLDAKLGIKNSKAPKH
jgi:hypothetical protein